MSNVLTPLTVECFEHVLCDTFSDKSKFASQKAIIIIYFTANKMSDTHLSQSLSVPAFQRGMRSTDGLHSI